MTQVQQGIPEFENDNLLAKIFTSRKWQKKLSNQNMNYQWIPCDQSQIQSMVSQVQVNIPNSYVDSCESDYFSFCMKMKISGDIMTNIVGGVDSWGQDPPSQFMIVQYQNALYMIMYNNDVEILPIKMLDKFVQAINSIDVVEEGDPLQNTKDFGYVTINEYNNKIYENINLDIAPKPAYVSTTENGENDTQLSMKAATVEVPNTMRIQFAYQKLMNLPYNSCCFLDRTVLNHQNVDKSKPLQQINRLIYRQQYDPNVTQQYMNQHWYIYYGNNKPQVIFTNNDYHDGDDVIFSYQVMIPMNKIFWMWQQDFLPLFKLKNPLNLQFIFNNSMMKNMFEVMTYKNADKTGGTGLNAVHANLTKLIDYNQITFYNIGCYLLVCSDTVMEKKLIEELNDMQGIVLPQTQTWIESYKTNTSEERQYQTNIGFNCLCNLELGLYADTNQAYYRGYSTLKDIFQEYTTFDKSNQLVSFNNPKPQDINWYNKQLSFYMPQITFNAKQTFIGQKFMNSIPLFMSINNRGQDTDDQNPFNENLFDYFNKLNIRYEQFTDKYVKDVESDEMNYSGVSIQKQNNNYITCLLANYNVSDYSANLTKYDGEIINLKNKTPSKDYFVELVYKYKQILQIDQAGNLTQMLQEYML